MKRMKILLMLCMLAAVLSACGEAGRQTAGGGQNADGSPAGDDSRSAGMNQNAGNGQSVGNGQNTDNRQNAGDGQNTDSGQGAGGSQAANGAQGANGSGVGSDRDGAFPGDDAMQDELAASWGNGDIYATAEYGNMEVIRQDCLDGDGEIAYYYVLECFYFYEDYPEALNRGLREFYDAYESEYRAYAEDYGTLAGETFGEAGEHTPYDQMCCMGLYYVGEDYVSLLYNGVSFMGGAHPYSRYEGVTLDRSTGERVSASQVLGRSDDDILREVSAQMGMDVTATWDDVDFYLTDLGLVFCYRMPGFYEDVTLPLP